MSAASTSIIVRPLASSEEYDAYFRTANQAFSPHPPSEENVQRRRHFLLNSPDFRPEQVRGAFRDGQFMGGYIMYERVLRMGAARISTGCIGAVATSLEFRRQGAASALLWEALDFAREQKHALLLLDGIPQFYRRFGYADIFDWTGIEVDRTAALAQPSGEYLVRAATVEDVAAMLALYERHFGGYTGSFEHSRASQVYRVSMRRPQNPAVVACAPTGEITGYLRLESPDDLGGEIAADNWDTLSALLLYHANLLAHDGTPGNLHYFLPLHAPMTHLLIDRLDVPDTSHWHSHRQEWGIHGDFYAHRFAGWMACLVDFRALMGRILGELQIRWHSSLAHWDGQLSLTVAGQTCGIRIDGTALQLTSTPDTNVPHVELTQQAFTQLLFGYRPLAELSPNVQLPADVCAVLAILFPQGHTWIPASDWF